MKVLNLFNLEEDTRFPCYVLMGIICATFTTFLYSESNPSTFAQTFSNYSGDISSFTDNNSAFNSLISDSTNSSTTINSTASVSESLISTLASDTFSSDESLINLASDAIENRLDKPKAILEILGKLPEIRNLSLVSLVGTDETPGIPSGSEPEKRQIANYILSNYPMDFVSVLFLLPNGDVYLLEPYSRQQNLSTSNLSFRDYYQGVMATNATFLGNVITSAASGLKQVQLAVPLYADASFNESKTNVTTPQSIITGILSTGLNLRSLDDIIRAVPNEGVIVLIDGKGKIVAQSSKNVSNLYDDEDNLFIDLKSYKLALNGENGTLVEEINGDERKISYTPVFAISNTWVILLIK